MHWIKFSTGAVIPLLLLSACGGEVGPTEAEMRNALQQGMSSNFTILSLTEADCMEEAEELFSCSFLLEVEMAFRDADNPFRYNYKRDKSEQTASFEKIREKWVLKNE